MNGDGTARVGVDIGGTFTDVVLERGSERHGLKVLTRHDAPHLAVRAGLATVLARAGIAAADVGVIIHGTTLATNALVERRGAPTALVTTAGVRDVIEMGTESRYEQYNLDLEKPAPLVPRHLRFGIAERLRADGEVLIPLDLASVEALVPRLRAATVESVAIGFLHSHVNPAHEQAVAGVLRRHLPHVALSLSSEVSPEIREYERFSTTCANAYVQPLIERYLGRLEQQLVEDGFRCPLLIMLSNGGIIEPAQARRFPVRIVESGPAGGVILAAALARVRAEDRVVAFDMGGTTAKLCLIDDGAVPGGRTIEIARLHRFKPGSGLPLRIPVVELVEIGAGGGSVAAVDTLGRIRVGPESTGSEPGPACYALGGEQATVTDADLVLGRVDPTGFAGGQLRLDPAAARTALERGIGAQLGCGADAAAVGVAEVVDENMANAAREHATERGLSITGRTLIAFGGAAPLHAARVAGKLGIDRILVPCDAGVGSAVGFLRAPVAYEVARSRLQVLDRFDPDALNELFAAMGAEAHAVVARAAVNVPRRETRSAYMRHVGQGHEILVPIPVRRLTAEDAGLLRQAFRAEYRRRYGRAIESVEVEAVSWSLTVTATTTAPPSVRSPAQKYRPLPAATRAVRDPMTGTVQEAALYRRADLRPGAALAGAALVVEEQTTTVVPSAFELEVDPHGNLVLQALTPYSLKSET